MSYPTDITNQFIELRAKCVSLQRIADTLQINLSTAKDWGRRFKPQIDDLKAIHFEAICEKITTTYQDELEYAMQQLHAVRGILRRRDWDYSETIELHRVEKALHKRVQSLRQLAELPDAPVDEQQPGPAANGEAPSTENPPISHPFPTQKSDIPIVATGEAAARPEGPVESPDSAPHGVPASAAESNGTANPEATVAESNIPSHVPALPPSHPLDSPVAPTPVIPPELDERPWWEREAWLREKSNRG